MLLESFNDDHVATVNKLNTIIRLSEKFLNEIISMTDHRKAHVRIMNAVISAIKCDNDVLGFCEVLKALISVQKRYTKEMFEFEAGKKTECIAMSFKLMQCCTLYNAYTSIIQYRIFGIMEVYTFSQIFN